MGKKAILVVHGIGQQARYSGVVEVANAMGKRWETDWAPTPVMETPAGARRGARLQSPDGDTVDVFEYYWAPITQGKASAGKVLLWIAKQTFARFEQLRRAPHWKTLLSGLMAVVALAFGLWLLMVLGNLALLAFELEEAEKGWSEAWAALTTADFWTSAQFSLDQVKAVWKWLSGDGLGAAASRLVLGVIVVYVAGQALRHIAFAVRAWTQSPPGWDDEDASTARWQSTAYAVVFTVATVIVVTVQPRNIPFALAVAVGYGLYRLVTSFLTDHFGDVYVYGSRNEFSDAYGARREIINEGQGLLRWLMLGGSGGDFELEALPGAGSTGKQPAAGNYDTVVIMAHSLGSVVAVDALRQTFVNLTPAERVEVADKAVLVTAGSPLALFSYIYGRTAPDKNRLNNFFKAGLVGDFALLKKWRNYWYTFDIGATMLAKSEAFEALADDPPLVLEDVQAGVGIPYRSHSKYWGDDDVLAYVSGQLGI